MAEKKKVIITFPFDPYEIPDYDNHVRIFEQNGFEIILDRRFRRLEQNELIELYRNTMHCIYPFRKRIDKKILKLANG
jgi:hypothetical protein